MCCRDIFLLNVLLNRREMAEIFWERSPQPVLSAITAAYLLRQMAEQDGVEPAVQVPDSLLWAPRSSIIAVIV